MWPHLISTLLAGYRSRSSQLLFVLASLMLVAAFLAGGFSGRQPQTVTLDVAISGMRIALVLMALIWSQDLLSKDIERKTILVFLAYPQPRWQYLLGRYLGVAVLLGCMIIVLGGAGLLLAQLNQPMGFKQPYPIHLAFLPAVLWGIWLDAIVVLAFCFLMAVCATTPYLPLFLGAAFAIAAKMLGPVISYLAQPNPANPDLVAHFGPLVQLLHWGLPDLSRLDWRESVLYGVPLDWTLCGIVSMQCLAYALALLLLATLVFDRRQFEA